MSEKQHVEKQIDVDFSEIGTSGLKHYDGEVYEERLRKLMGDKKKIILQEMEDNDATIGAILFVIEMLMRQVEWKTKPFDDSPESLDQQEFLTECLNDMSMPIKDVIANIISTMLVQGHAPTEIVVKRRTGKPFFAMPGENGKEAGSKYSDGRIGWHKLSVRAPETISRWKFAPNGDIEGFWQKAPPEYKEVWIPIEKILLFRTSSKKNNPEGKSIIRNAYRAWYFKKKIENIEAIGIERDLAGLPTAYVPPEIMSSQASPKQKALFEQIKKIITNIRRDEQEGVIFPLQRDAEGNKMYELTLLSTGGTRQFKTNEPINRYRQDMAMTVLADFILLGHEKVGSFSLSSSKTNIFTMAITAWLEMISEIFNRKAIPMLFWMNGFQLDKLPTISYGDIESVDLIELSNYINALTGAGIDLTDTKTQNYLRSQANIPSAAEGDDL